MTNARTVHLTIRVENAYSDGHESTQEHAVTLTTSADTQPTDDGLEAMWDLLWDYTGDGHGADDPDLGWCYTITIIESDWPELVGLSYENCGN